MKAQNVSKELRSNQPSKLASVNISYQLSDTKRSKGECRGKKIRCIEQLDLDRLGQTINISHYLTKKNDKENSGKHATRHKKKSTDEKITSTFRRKKHHSNIVQDLQSTRPKPQTGRSAQQAQRLGKSLDYKRYLNKQMFPTKKSKSQSCSPRKKSTSKDKIRKPTIITTKTRPSSVRTSNPTQTLNTLLNTRFNKTDNSNKLRELLNSMKEESLREILENSFEKQRSGSFEKRESSRKLKTKKKVVGEGRRAKGKQEEEGNRRFTKKKPLEEVYQDANIDGMNTRSIVENSVATDSIGFRQHSDSKDTPLSGELPEDIEIVKLTESQEINIIEIRDFEHKKLSGRQSKSGDYDHSSGKVQNTKELLLRYIEIFNAGDESEQIDSQYEKTKSFGIEEGSLNGSEVQFRVGRQGITADALRMNDHIETSSENDFHHPTIEIEPQHFYESEENNRKITVVSNLSDLKSQQEVVKEEPNAKFQKIINHIRQEQLHKWNSIVQIISQSLNSDEVNTKDLLKKIAEQSEENYQKLRNEVEEHKKSKKIEHYHSLGDSDQGNNDEADPFQQFNSKKYKELLDPSIVQNLIKSREKFLTEREKTQKRLIEDKYETDQISIGSYKRNCDRLEKWVNAERISIQKTRKQIQMGLGKAKQAIKKTQLDYVIMLKLKGSPIRPLKKSHSEQGFSRHLRNSRNKRKPQDTISITSSQQQLQDYIHNAQFDVESQNENDRLDSSNTVMLKQKLQKLNEQQREVSEEEMSDPSRVLRRQTNQPLHRTHIEVSENSEIRTITDHDIEDQEFGPARIARIISDSNQPENLSQDCCKEAFDELIVQFLKEISLKDQLVENFKKLKVTKPVVSKKRQKGIKTNIASVREYVRSLEAFLLGNKMDILVTLQKPTGPTAKEMLKYMHYYEDQPVQEDEQIQNSVLSNGIFQEHWKQIQAKLDFQPQYSQPQRQKARVEYLKGLTRIHYLSIFQAYNECLDQQRNFGTFGQPFPWKRVPNFFHQKREPPTVKKCLESVSKKINSLATSFCGIIFDRDDCTVDYSEEYIAQIQDDRVTRMLALEVMENEHKWLFYDDEETEILVEVAFVISETLVNELVLELHQMMFLR